MYIETRSYMNTGNNKDETEKKIKVEQEDNK